MSCVRVTPYWLLSARLMPKRTLRLVSRAFALLLAFTAACPATCHVWAQDKHFLWKVSGDKNTVYILGSIHLLKRGSAELKPIVEEVFNRSERLVLEIDLLNEGPGKFQQLLTQKGLSEDGKQLQQQMSPDTYELTLQRAADLGVDLKLLAPFKPWVVALTMVVMHLQKLGYDPNSGIDHQLAHRARQDNKPVSGLETAESQIDIFDGLSPREQDMFLRESLLEMDHLEKSLDEVVETWNSGDAARGERLFLESMRAYPELKTKVLDERNRNWLRQIEQFLKQDGDVLVVVGAAHLVGKEGVIELLKARGYKLEQM